MLDASARTPLFEEAGFSHTERLNLESARARPVHGYLFVGRDEAALLRAARLLFVALNCPYGGCGECAFCRASVSESAAVPDFVVIYPEGTGIFVEQAQREIVRPAYESPYAARLKFIVVVEAELLNQEASNALLKALEEPPPTTVFVLLAEREGQLLPTVRSRLAVMRFGAPADTTRGGIAAPDIHDAVTALFNAVFVKEGLLDVEERLARLIAERARTAREASDELLRSLKEMDLDPEYVRWRERNEKRRVERAERRARLDVLKSFIDHALRLVNEALMLARDESYNLGEDAATYDLVDELSRVASNAQLLELQELLVEANAMLRVGVSPDQLGHALILKVWKVFRG